MQHSEMRRPESFLMHREVYDAVVARDPARPPMSWLGIWDNARPWLETLEATRSSASRRSYAVSAKGH